VLVEHVRVGAMLIGMAPSSRRGAQPGA
jgi:hypothetical protein